MIRHYLLVEVEPAHGSTVRDTHGCGLLTIDQEIARAAVEGPVEFGIWKARTVDDRFVITGEEASRFPQPGDPHWSEILFKEFACLSCANNLCSHRAPAGVQETLVDRSWVARPPAVEKRLAAREKGRESHSVVIGRPAVEIGPFNRLELRVGKFQRIYAGAICHTAGAHQPSHRNNNQSTRAGSEDVNAVESYLHRGHITP